MKVAVRYFSRSGRTKKVADAIAAEVGVEALPVSKGLTEDVNTLFLGCGIYGTIGSDIGKFVSSIDTKVGKVVSFSTSAVAESAYPQIKRVVEKNGLKISDKEFHCPGTLALRYKDRPNQDDLQNAANFAKEIIKE